MYVGLDAGLQEEALGTPEPMPALDRFPMPVTAVPPDEAVAEIAHGTGHIKTLRDVPHRPAKTHALDIAFVKDLNGCRHASEDCCGFAPAATARCRFIAPVRERRAADLPAAEPGADRSSSD